MKQLCVDSLGKEKSSVPMKTPCFSFRHECMERGPHLGLG